MLTQKRLSEVLRYEPETGEFFWISQRGSRSDLVGARAGWMSHRGYWCMEIDAKYHSAHRLAWLYVHGKFPKGQLDHINRDRADNRIANLRLASQSQNLANSKSKPSLTGLKGAHWNKRWNGSWSSSIHRDGKRVWLGVFATAEEAHAAYCKAAQELHGDFFYVGKD